MSPELTFLLTLALRMAITAAFVVSASVITEKSGPVIGALVATLPISAGPSYVFLALDHDAVRDLLTVTGQRTHAELRGVRCFPFATTEKEPRRHPELRAGGHVLGRDARSSRGLCDAGRGEAAPPRAASFRDAGVHAHQSFQQ